MGKSSKKSKRKHSPEKKKSANKKRKRSTSSESSTSEDEHGPPGRNYSVREVEVLIEEYRENGFELDSNSKTVPAVRKRDIMWTSIAKKVSAVHGKSRSGSSCQDKIKKLKSALKLEERFRSKYAKATGNLNDDDIERKIRKKMNKPLMDKDIRALVLPLLTAVQKHGIEGGIDTSQAVVEGNMKVFSKKKEKDLSLSQIDLGETDDESPTLPPPPEAEQQKSPTPPPWSPEDSQNPFIENSPVATIDEDFLPSISPLLGDDRILTRACETDCLNHSDIRVINTAARAGMAIIVKAMPHSGRLIIRAHHPVPADADFSC